MFVSLSLYLSPFLYLATHVLQLKLIEYIELGWALEVVLVRDDDDEDDGYDQWMDKLNE